MICPNCGATVADGALRCPRCRFELGATQTISLGKTLWCPSCGALVPEGATTCPKCGSDVAPERPRRATRDLKLPEIGNTSGMYALTEEQLRGQAEIESAIPSAEDGAGAARDRMPRPRVFAVAALCALFVVGGGALAITHPWDPHASNISAKEPADTSQSGFPGRVDELTGQDGASSEAADSGELLVKTLTSYHERLGELSGRADALEEALDTVGASGSSDERASERQDMDTLAIEVSNLINDISEYATNETYADAISDLESQASWLRNRCDALKEAWKLAAESSDPAADAERVRAAAAKGASFKELFAKAYGDWSLGDAS